MTGSAAFREQIRAGIRADAPTGYGSKAGVGVGSSGLGLGIAAAGGFTPVSIIAGGLTFLGGIITGLFSGPQKTPTDRLIAAHVKRLRNLTAQRAVGRGPDETRYGPTYQQIANYAGAMMPSQRGTTVSQENIESNPYIYGSGD